MTGLAAVAPSTIHALLACAASSTGEPHPETLQGLAIGDAVPAHRVEAWLAAAGCAALWTGRAAFADWDAETVYWRPDATHAHGSSGVCAAAFVAYLLTLHRLGVDAGACAAVDALRPTLARRRVLTDDELRVWWAPNEIDKFRDPLLIRTTAPWPSRVTVAGRSGHTASVVPTPNGAVVVGHGVKPSARRVGADIIRAHISPKNPE